MAEEKGESVDLASLPEGKAPDGAERLLYTNFARERTIRRANGNVYGNWSSSFAQACIGGFDRYIPEGAIQNLERVGSCPNGEAVIKAENY